MCYIIGDEYLAVPVLLRLQCIDITSTLAEQNALATVIVVAGECRMKPAALAPIAIKHTYPGHPHTINFRVYGVDSYEAIFACPQYPLPFKIIYFGQQLGDNERSVKLFGELKPYWSE